MPAACWASAEEASASAGALVAGASAVVAVWAVSAVVAVRAAFAVVAVWAMSAVVAVRAAFAAGAAQSARLVSATPAECPDPAAPVRPPWAPGRGRAAQARRPPAARAAVVRCPAFARRGPDRLGRAGTVRGAVPGPAGAALTARRFSVRPGGSGRRRLPARAWVRWLAAWCRTWRGDPRSGFGGRRGWPRAPRGAPAPAG